MFGNYKDRINKNKQKTIKKDVKHFKKLCLKEVKKNVKKGLDTTFVDFFCNVNSDFEDEISEIVLKELIEEYKNINFSFCFRHFQNSYKGIKIIIK